MTVAAQNSPSSLLLPAPLPPFRSQVLSKMGKDSCNLEYEDIEEYFNREHNKNYKSRLNKNFEYILLDNFQYADMRFLIGQLKGKLVLSEDKDGRSLLRTAVENLRLDCVELLLLYGADPYRVFGPRWAQLSGEDLLLGNVPQLSIETFETSWTNRIKPSDHGATGFVSYRDLRRQRLEFRTRELAALLDLHRLRWENRPKFALTWLDCTLGPPKYIPNIVIQSIPNVTMASNILPTASFGPFEHHERCFIAWFHLFDTIGTAILPIARAIGRKVCDDRDIRVSSACSIVEFFHRSFCPTIIIPQVSFLRNRKVGYNSQSISCHEDEIDCVAIVFPCLVIDRRAHWMKRRDYHNRIRTQYPTGLMGVYIERTLDETYYPGLDKNVLDLMNDDQVIDKQHRKQAKDELNDEERPIMLVPQLWLWKVDNRMVSAYSMTRMMDIFAPNPNNHQTLMPQLYAVNSIDLQMAYVLESFIYCFGQPYKENGKIIFQSILDQFETALVTVNFDVRDYLSRRITHDIDLEKEKEYIESISDIRNELDMIQTIIDQQNLILNSFREDIKRKREQREEKAKKEKERAEQQGLSEEDQLLMEFFEEYELDELEDEDKFEKKPIVNEVTNALLALERGMDRLALYSKHISIINRDADKISKIIDDRLNLSRVDASIREAKSSVSIGYVTLAFAIVTIVFVPLNFVASLMALPSNYFMDQQHKYSNSTEDDTRVYKSGYLAGVFMGVEFVSLLITGGVTLLVYRYAFWSGSKARGKMTHNKDCQAEKRDCQVNSKELQADGQNYQASDQDQETIPNLHGMEKKQNRKDNQGSLGFQTEEETPDVSQIGNEIV